MTRLRQSSRSRRSACGCDSESALRVTFEQHYAAEAAADSEVLNAELVYNERPYEARGQCVVEKGIALTATAHMRMAEKHGQPAARYLHAQSTRPKLIELRNGEILKISTEDRPQKVVERTASTLKNTKLCSTDERRRLNVMVANIEFFLERAMDEAGQMMQLDRFSISKALLTQLRQVSSVTLPQRQRDNASVRIDWKFHKGQMDSARASAQSHDDPYSLALVLSPCHSGMLCVGNGGADSAAEQAGLHMGSVIIAIDNKVTRSLGAAQAALDGCKKDNRDIVLLLARATRLVVVDRQPEGWDAEEPSNGAGSSSSAAAPASESAAAPRFDPAIGRTPTGMKIGLTVANSPRGIALQRQPGGLPTKRACGWATRYQA